MEQNLIQFNFSIWHFQVFSPPLFHLETRQIIHLHCPIDLTQWSWINRLILWVPNALHHDLAIFVDFLFTPFSVFCFYQPSNGPWLLSLQFVQRTLGIKSRKSLKKFKHSDRERQKRIQLRNKTRKTTKDFWLTYDSTMIGLKVFWADTLRFMVVLAIVSILHDNNWGRNQSNISSTKSKMLSKPSCTSGQLD